MAIELKAKTMTWTENSHLRAWYSGNYRIYAGVKSYTLYANDTVGYRLIGRAETLAEAQELASMDREKHA